MKPFPDTFWKYATVVSITALLLLACRSPNEPTLAADVVRAREFVLVDAAGKPIGAWGSDAAYPKGISFCMYDPESKSGDPSVRILTVDGGVDIMIAGEQGNGAVGLMTSKGNASLTLFDSCNDPSHSSPLRSGVVMLSADRTVGRLQVIRRIPVTIDGQHMESGEAFLTVPATESAPTSPSGK